MSPEKKLELQSKLFMEKVSSKHGKSESLDLIDFAMGRIAQEEAKVHKQVSQFQKNRLALEFVKLNQDILRHSQIQPRREAA